MPAATEGQPQVIADHRHSRRDEHPHARVNADVAHTADAVVNDVTGGGALNGMLIDLLTADPGYVQTCRIAFRRTSAATPAFDPTCPNSSAYRQDDFLGRPCDPKLSATEERRRSRRCRR